MPANLVYGSRPGDDDTLSGAEALAEQRLDRQRIAAQATQAQMQNQIAQSKLGLEAQGQAFDQNMSQKPPAALQSGYLSAADANGRNDQGPLDPRATGEVLDSQLDQIIQAVGQQRLNPQGQAVYADWAGKFRQVQKMRSRIRPHQYNKLAAQLIGEFRQSRINNYVVHVPTVQENWLNNAIPSHDGGFIVQEYDKNGHIRFKKIDAGPADNDHLPMTPQQRFESSIVRTPDGGYAIHDPNNAWKIQAAPKPEKKEPDRESLSQYLSNRANYNKEYTSAHERLVKQGGGKLDADGNPMQVVPAPHEIIAEMDRYLNAQEAHIHGRYHGEQVTGPLPGAVGVQPPQQPAQPPGGAPQAVRPQVAPPQQIQPGSAAQVPPAVIGGMMGMLSPGGQSAPQQPGQQPSPQPVPPAPPKLDPNAAEAIAKHALSAPHPTLQKWEKSDGVPYAWGHGQPLRPSPKLLALNRQLHKQLGGDELSQYALSVLTGAWHVYPHVSDLTKTTGRSADMPLYHDATQVVVARLKGVHTPEADAIRDQMHIFAMRGLSPQAQKEVTDKLSADNKKPGSNGVAPKDATYDAAKKRLPLVKTDADFKALAKGQEFVDPNGITRVKP